jgi:hypothetical protein
MFNYLNVFFYIIIYMIIVSEKFNITLIYFDMILKTILYSISYISAFEKLIKIKFHTFFAQKLNFIGSY